MFALALLYIFAIQYFGVKSECNVCANTSNIACVSRTKFQFCTNGLPVEPVNSCPNGYVCSSTDAAFCKPDVTGVAVSCTGCNTCNNNLTFACTGAQTYALCLNTNVISNITGTCSSDLVCNMDYAPICGSPLQGIFATCATVEDTTTLSPTPSPITDPDGFCQTIQQNGRFQVGIDVSTTCRQYVYCTIYNSVWLGQLYDCPGSTYFNSSSRLCSAGIPSDCV